MWHRFCDTPLWIGIALIILYFQHDSYTRQRKAEPTGKGVNHDHVINMTVNNFIQVSISSNLTYLVQNIVFKHGVLVFLE